jgi:hypothetical protein
LNASGAGNTGSRAALMRAANQTSINNTALIHSRDYSNDGKISNDGQKTSKSGGTFTSGDGQNTQQAKTSNRLLGNRQAFLNQTN